MLPYKPLSESNSKVGYINSKTGYIGIQNASGLSGKQGGNKSHTHLLYQVAECILKYDTVNEDAIAIKCAALYNLGKKGFARNAYDSFCREYKNLMEIEFTIPFNELLKVNMEQEGK